eukprot:scaffold139469_cov289-Phaeocystis_antarctica.AAC.1
MRASTAVIDVISRPSHTRSSGRSASTPSGGDSESIAKPDSTTHVGRPLPPLESRCATTMLTIAPSEWPKIATGSEGARRDTDVTKRAASATVSSRLPR